MFHAKILCINLGHSSFGIPRSASSSRTVSRWSLLIAAHIHWRIFMGWLQNIQRSQVFCLLQAFQNVDHFQHVLRHLWSICATLLFALHSCNILESLLNHLNSFHGGMFKLNAKFDADSLLYLLSHFQCDGHTVHMHTQQCLYPHWPVQWSCHCSHVCIPVHCPWLPGYSMSCQPFSLY